MSFLRKQGIQLIPAQAGTEGIWTSAFFWIPAFAGMTSLARLGWNRPLPPGERPVASFG